MHFKSQVFIQGGEDRVNKTNSMFKFLGVSLLGIFGLWLIFSLLLGSGYGFNAGFTGRQGGEHMYMSYGYGFSSTIAFLLLFLIKVLFVLFIVGLVVGIAIAIKNYIFTEEDVQKIKNTFTGRKTTAVKEACNDCGKEIAQGWRICPYCGKELTTQNV
jgi:hypothetical protein